MNISILQCDIVYGGTLQSQLLMGLSAFPTFRLKVRFSLVERSSCRECERRTEQMFGLASGNISSSYSLCSSKTVNILILFNKVLIIFYYLDIGSQFEMAPHSLGISNKNAKAVDAGANIYMQFLKIFYLLNVKLYFCEICVIVMLCYVLDF
jgi:hypothetical protein